MNIGTARRHDNAFQHVASSKCVFVDRLHACGYLDAFDAAVGKSAFSERNYCAVVGKGNLFHSGRVAESVVMNASDRSWEVKLFQLLLIGKNTRSNSFQFAATQEVEVGEIITTNESPSPYCFKFRTIGHIHGFQFLTSSKSIT